VPHVLRASHGLRNSGGDVLPVNPRDRCSVRGLNLEVGQQPGFVAMIHEDISSPGAAIAAGTEGERKSEVLFLEDVAEMLRVSRSTIERRRREGTFPVPELPSLDRRPRWSRRSVEQYLGAGRWSAPRRGRPRRRLG
jgi:predicted DNA-binding transcriptional regulator AlpA